MSSLIRSTKTVYADLSDWFHEQDGNLVAYELIARQYRKLLNKYQHPNATRPVMKADLDRAISRSRMELESRYKTTLFNVRGQGYKVADANELALYTAKFIKRTIFYCDRTYRLVEITDKDRIPSALQQVFSDTGGRIKTLSLRGKKYVDTLLEYLKEKERKELSLEKEAD